MSFLKQVGVRVCPESSVVPDTPGSKRPSQVSTSTASNGRPRVRNPRLLTIVQATSAAGAASLQRGTREPPVRDAVSAETGAVSFRLLEGPQSVTDTVSVLCAVANAAHMGS
eukprot:1004054-Prorocentrum_minimum.AAC.2